METRKKQLTDIYKSATLSREVFGVVEEAMENWADSGHPPLTWRKDKRHNPKLLGARELQHGYWVVHCRALSDEHKMGLTYKQFAADYRKCSVDY